LPIAFIFSHNFLREIKTIASIWLLRSKPKEKGKVFDLCRFAINERRHLISAAEIMN